jgi:N-formylglutamate amidohydrolase
VWPIAKDILRLSKINALRGLMPRTLVDYNRAWPVGINYYPLTQKEVHTALDDVRLVQAYQHYHASIDRILDRSIVKFGKEKTLMIDLHGFAKQPPYAPSDGYYLILGTGNRVSIPHGDIDIRLAKYMADLGYKVFLPKNLSTGPEEDHYSADFTTRHHSEKHNVNVIQIEVASRFRRKESRELGQELAKNFAGFLDNYCL